MDTWFVLEIDSVDEAELNARLAAHGLCIHRDKDADVVCLIGVNETPLTYDDMMIGAVGAQAEVDALRKDAERYRWLRDSGRGERDIIWDYQGEGFDRIIDSEISRKNALRLSSCGRRSGKLLNKPKGGR